MKKYKNYKHIIDDGDCDGHGYNIPVLNNDLPVCSTPVPISIVNVPDADLQDVLRKLSEKQAKRLKDAEIKI